MSAGSPEPIFSHNLSLAWRNAFHYVLDVSDAKLRPMVVTISDFNGTLPPEVQSIREAVDADLSVRCRNLSCEHIASTIFPHQYWSPERPADELFDFYKRAFPRLMARARKANSQWGKGMYFHRLIAPYGDYEQNQLAHVIGRWNKGCHHGMVTQLSCREVMTDQNNSSRPGFPCLQQVGLTHTRDASGNYELWLNAFYPLQDMVERAYGNYLGLCRLGTFLAHYMDGCRFAGLNCFVAKPTRGGASKSDLEQLRRAVRTSPEPTEQAGS